MNEKEFLEGKTKTPNANCFQNVKFTDAKHSQDVNNEKKKFMFVCKCEREKERNIEKKKKKTSAACSLFSVRYYHAQCSI